jgi:hypothetical protein
LQLNRAVFVDERHHGVNLVDAPHGLFQHHRVRVPVPVWVWGRSDVGDNGRLRFLVHDRLGKGVFIVAVGGGHRQMLQLAAVEANQVVLFFGQRFAAQLFFGHHLQGSGQALQPHQAVQILLSQQPALLQPFQRHRRQRFQRAKNSGTGST